MQPENLTPDAEIASLRRRLERERATRLAAESIAEKGLRDLYQRQQELILLDHITAAANQSRSARDILQFAIEELCTAHSWDAGHGYLVEATDETTTLHSAGAWYAADRDAVKNFEAISASAIFASGIGLPGRALESAKPLWIANLDSEHNFPRLRVAQECGLKCATSFPVLSGSEVVAVIEFFSGEAREPDTGLLDVMGQIGMQLGRVIERQRSEDKLRAQTEELIKARDEATAADRAKSSFLANMSHELRTPLNAIIGFSEMMQHQIFGPLSEKYKSYADDIHYSGVHLKNILNDILDISKIEVGALDLRDSEVSVPALLQSCHSFVASLAVKGAVALSFDVPTALPPIRADEMRLKQAVLNILSNAVKFTLPGGRVDVRAYIIGMELIIAISDTGIGMSDDDLAIALQPFRQIDGSLNRRYEGTGLGLPLAKAFVELHGGRLDVASAAGHGTTMKIVIPGTRITADTHKAQQQSAA